MEVDIVLYGPDVEEQLLVNEPAKGIFLIKHGHVVRIIVKDRRNLKQHIENLAHQLLAFRRENLQSSMENGDASHVTPANNIVPALYVGPNGHLKLIFNDIYCLFHGWQGNTFYYQQLINSRRFLFL